MRQPGRARVHGKENEQMIRTTIAGIVLTVALSGCGVFCGAQGGTGNFAGGCSTGVHF